MKTKITKTTKINKESKKESKKESNNMQEEQIKRMQDMSGENETRLAPKYILPTLKVNGKEGGFSMTVIEDGKLKLGEDEKCLMEKVEKPAGVFLRVRKELFYNGSEIQYFTGESSGRNPIFTVFEKRQNKEGFSINAVGEGTIKDVKQLFPELKMRQVIYFLLITKQGSKIVRLKVKGMSLGNLFDYMKKFSGNEDLHLVFVQTSRHILRSRLR